MKVKVKKFLAIFFLLYGIFLYSSSDIIILEQNSSKIKFILTYFENPQDAIQDNELFLLGKENFLPYYQYNFIISDFNTVSVRYTILDSTSLSLKKFYEFSDSLFFRCPDTPITHSEPFILRDFRGISINYYPFIKRNNEVFIANKVEVEICTESEIGKNPLNIHHENIPMYFHQIYKQFFSNYSYFETDNIVTEKAVIIYSQKKENFAQIFLNTLIGRGIKAVSYVYPQDTGYGKNELKNFIYNMFRKSEEFTFLIFLKSEKDPLFNDRNYSSIIGNDNIPDFVVAFLDNDNNAEMLLDSLKSVSNGINFNFSSKNLNIKFAEEEDNLVEFTTDTRKRDAYIFPPLKDIEIDNLYYLTKRNIEDYYYISQIPFLYHLFNQKEIKIMTDPTIRLDKQEDKKLISKIESFSNEQVTVTLDLDCFPIKNAYVSLLNNGNVYDSKITNEDGSVSFDMNSNSDIFPLQLVFYNNHTGYSYKFFIPQKENSAIQDTVLQFLNIFPNPFYPEKNKNGITISFELKNDTFISASVYNVLGQTIKNLDVEFAKKGTNFFHWDGKDQNGKFVSNGIYYIMIKYHGKIEVCKVLVLK